MTDTPDLAALAERLERLETIEAARSALYRYVDVVRVEDGAWRIASKTITVDVHADSRTGWAGEITP